MGSRHEYIDIVPSTILPSLRGEDGKSYVEFEVHLKIINDIYEKFNERGREISRILNLCDDKDAEIEKYKAKSEYTEREMNKKIHDYLNEIDELKCRIRELEESQEELPIEPIKVADYLISKKGKTNVPGSICELANYFPIYSTFGLREIAEHLLVYCDYAEDE